MNDKKPKIGVVGAGHLGKHHIKHLSNHKGVDFVGVFDTNEDSLKNSLQMSKVSEFIDQFQNGINSRIGEQGSKISGGQKQRIALARAFYHQKEFIVMDESTSSLDTNIENRIIDSIKDIKNKKTIVVIAHRLSTLKYCNRIYKIENMKVKCFDNYNDVLKSN